MSFVFISYSRQDQAYVSLLVQVLQSHHLPVWLDDRINYGSTWPKIIQENLEKCAVFVVVMSPRSEDSHWVQCELSLALELKKPIFPLLLEGRRWLSVAAIQSVDVEGGKLPPARFFDTVRAYFSKPIETAESIAVKDVAEEKLVAPKAKIEGTLPAVSRKELHECDRSKLRYLKNIRDPKGGWSYTLDHIERIGGARESRVFEIYWLLTSRGAQSPTKGDLMILNQKARVTHVVEMLDDEVRETESGYFRWVRIVWMPEEKDWSQLPHQDEVLGFKPPRFGGGTAYSFTSPNFKKFHAAWNSLEGFQRHIFEQLCEANNS